MLRASREPPAQMAMPPIRGTGLVQRAIVGCDIGAGMIPATSSHATPSVIAPHPRTEIA
jgi:hypothetical protein